MFQERFDDGEESRFRRGPQPASLIPLIPREQVAGFDLGSDTHTQEPASLLSRLQGGQRGQRLCPGVSDNFLLATLARGIDKGDPPSTSIFALKDSVPFPGFRHGSHAPLPLLLLPDSALPISHTQGAWVEAPCSWRAPPTLIASDCDGGGRSIPPKFLRLTGFALVFRVVDTLEFFLSRLTAGTFRNSSHVLVRLLFWEIACARTMSDIFRYDKRQAGQRTQSSEIVKTNTD
jgi:hypothetical protein